MFNFAIIFFIFALAHALPLRGQDPNYPLPYHQGLDGTVFHSLYDAGREWLYLAGSFRHYQPNRGHLALVNAQDGGADMSFPSANARVRAIVPDHEGGHYIIGDFSELGNLNSPNLGHMAADGSLRAMNLQLLSNEYIIQGICLGPHLYLAGDFSQIQGHNLAHLARINRSTGLVDSSWRPNPNNFVHKLSFKHGFLYVAGGFQEIGGVLTNLVARFDVQNNRWDEDFLLGLSLGQINALTLSDDLLILSQAVAWNEDEIRSYSLVDGGQTPDVNITAYDEVYALTVSGSYLYFGGGYQSSTPSHKAFVNRFHIQNRQIDSSWQVEVNQSIVHIFVHDSYVYLGGLFNLINGRYFSNFARVHLRDGSLDLNWRPSINGGSGTINAMVAHQGQFILGGGFPLFGGQARSGVLALDRWGGLKDFNSEVKGWVNRLFLSPRGLYILGDFWEPSPSKIARLNPQTGELDAAFNFNLPSHFQPTALCESDQNGRLFIAGHFNDQSNEVWLGRLDETLGLDPSWPLVRWNGEKISALQFYDQKLFVGGKFSFSQQGQIFHHFIAINTSDGSLNTTWSFSISDQGEIKTFKRQANQLYLGGRFSQIGGLPFFGGLARLNLDLGSIDNNWRPSLGGLNNLAVDLLFYDHYLYVCGEFLSVNSQVTGPLAKVDKIDGRTDFGQVGSFYLSSGNSALHTLNRVWGGLCIGGSFSHISLGAFHQRQDFLHRNYAILTANDLTPSLSLDNQRVFKAFPNPLGQTLTLQLKAEDLGKGYALFDVQGRLLLSGRIGAEWEVLVLPANLAAGLYVLELEGYEAISLIKN